MRNVKKVLYVAIIGLVCWGIGPGYCLAGESGHYVNGVEGIKAATLPPPGFYYRMYNVFYTADTLADQDGNALNVNFDAGIYALVNRFIWITDFKLLGGNFFVDMVIPLVNTDIEIGALGISENRFGLADINIEPFGISWHGLRYDAAMGLSVYMPTGDYDRTEPASPGKGFWTGMFTLGGTVYFDAAKTWAASILSRYEIHSDKESQDIRPGDDFHFEWGLSKTLAKFWDVGLTGYCQWQVTDDSGSDAVNADVHDRVYAAGPEASAFCPGIKAIFSLRSQWEFDARDRSEGNVTTLTITKIF
ncbi:MAG: transporter [Pseudomonadota bacterium]